MLRGFYILVAVLTLVIQGQAAELQFDFSKTPVNKQPEGFKTFLTGNGSAPEWKVLLDAAPSEFAPLTSKGASGNKSAVLAQTSTDTTDEHFPGLVYDGQNFGDFTFTTKFKLVDGKKERMAGIVFRYLDKYNYYVLRASGLGNTFRFYKFVNGLRSKPIGPDIVIPSGVWHEISVKCEANKINCFLNGKQVIPELTDNSFNVGKVGFWTKSDSVCYFTGAKITYTPREIYAQKIINSLMEKYPRTLGLKLYGPKPQSPDIVLLASSFSDNKASETDEVAVNTLIHNTPYVYQGKEIVKVTLPVHDRNGDPMAAIRVELKPFIGETEQTSLIRATVYKKDIEARVTALRELFE